jgi:hypothetical protein
MAARRGALIWARIVAPGELGAIRDRCRRGAHPERRPARPTGGQ